MSKVLKNLRRGEDISAKHVPAVAAMRRGPAGSAVDSLPPESVRLIADSRRREQHLQQDLARMREAAAVLKHRLATVEEAMRILQGEYAALLAQSSRREAELGERIRALNARLSAAGLPPDPHEEASARSVGGGGSLLSQARARRT